MSNKKHKNKNQSKNQPFVSICTPTFNRRPFISALIKCIELQDYPKEKIEWVIIDDGTDPIEDLVKDITFVNVKYFYYNEQLLLGKKRNIMHSKCSGDIIIYMDDDDYYPSQRVSHAVEMLLKNPNILIAGSSEMHIYFHHLNEIYQGGPYGKYHSTAATFAFRKELLNETHYNDENALSEETLFLKKYSIPLVQLDTNKTILVIAHSHNSFDKRIMLETPKDYLLVLSKYKLNDFIKDNSLLDFYTRKIHELLPNYKIGSPENKPEVLRQIKEMKANRDKKKEEYMKQMETKQKINQFYSQTQTQSFTDIEKVKEHYEKIIADKTYLINELLKKVKDLTVELNRQK
jgi:glycosyltransferase involved in cell wall biosynthesis